jgi:hypothetical protein
VTEERGDFPGGRQGHSACKAGGAPMDPLAPVPPPALATQPDQIEDGALAEIDFLDGEKVQRVWQVRHGYLVLTNLRCLRVWKKLTLFEGAEWHTGPSFFFYNLNAPRVVAGRFVELSEEVEENAGSARFQVRDPEEVAGEIEASRAAGQLAWQARRAHAREVLRRSTVQGPAYGSTVVREVVHEVVRVRCPYCGNLMDETDERCPSCGAGVR